METPATLWSPTASSVIWTELQAVKIINVNRVKSELIDLKEFKQAVGFRGSKYVSRMFQLFDADSDGTIDFKEFVRALSTLSDRGTIDEKLALSFLIYDADGDGKISPTFSRR